MAGLILKRASASRPCFGLIAVDADDSGWLSLYVGGASIALAAIMFWVWKINR
jgi:hypothetical protein